ncbi:MAG TPA: hypothetical protein VG847_15520, partial [Chitinophagaceae bacterium]|nr:hypothetical protein [Chitinophagaceae bacterium]
MKKGSGYRLLSYIMMLAATVSAANAQDLHEQGFLPASSTFSRQRFTTAVVSEAGVSAITTLGLQYLWYKKFPHSRFHFFNDNNEWLNMDKIGH